MQAQGDGHPPDSTSKAVMCRQPAQDEYSTLSAGERGIKELQLLYAAGDCRVAGAHTLHSEPTNNRQHHECCSSIRADQHQVWWSNLAFQAGQEIGQATVLHLYSQSSQDISLVQPAKLKFVWVCAVGTRPT